MVEAVRAGRREGQDAMANNYDKDDHKTWAVYDNPHLIMPVEDGTYAIWLTEEATYLAEAFEMNWMREYFGLGGNNMLVDQRGLKRESGQTHRKTWKRHTRSLLYQNM